MNTVVRASYDNLYILGYSLVGLFTHWRLCGLCGAVGIYSSHACLGIISKHSQSHYSLLQERQRLNSSSPLIFQHV